MLKPQNMGLKQGWSALKEARKGNLISQNIYNRFAEVNAMPMIGEPECETLKSYEDFMKYHVRIWYMD